LLFAFWQKGPGTGKKKKRRRKGKPGRKKKRGPKVTDYTAAAKRRRALYRERKRRKQRRVKLSNGVHYRSKNELARCLVWKLVRRGIRVKFILFDNWYASYENLALFERLGLYWVTRSKDNAKVYYDENRLMVKEVASTVKKTNYHYYSALGARARSFQVKLGNRFVKLTVIKDDTAPERDRTKYLMTNALWLTNQEHIQWYRKRWSIEVFFRDAKQYLGLAKCEVRTTEAVISHVALVCVAYTFLQLLKPVSSQQRPSIRASKNALAPLQVVVHVNWQIVRPKSTGALEPLSYDHLWHPVRTGVLKLPCPHLIDFT
jgi:SRSO17 transposase